MFDFEKLLPTIPFILKGIHVTLLYTSLSVILGTAWGSLLALCRISTLKILKNFSIIYISIFRGTPLLVQLSLIYYATPQLMDYKISAFEAALISFSLNSAAYIAEIIRSGVQAVDPGQMEAGLCLGLSRSIVLRDIIFPQAIKNILPALVNEFISLLKESVIVSMIGEMDLFRRATLISYEKYIYFEPLLLIALVYYILVVILTSFTKMLEKRLKRSD